MRIAIIALGSRGDVQPYLALATGLQAAGHSVVLATHEEFTSFLAEYGIEIAPLPAGVSSIAANEVGRRLRDSGQNPFTFIRQVAAFLRISADETLNRCVQACRGADAIIFSILGIAGYDIAEKMGVPAIPAFVQVLVRTRAFSVAGTLTGLPWRPLRRLVHYVSFFNTEQIFGQGLKSLSNGWRRSLGLPPLPPLGLNRKMYLDRLPVLCGFSPTVVPKPPDWGDWVHVTGYWFLPSREWTPPAALVEFIQAGPPPVYLGYGSLSAVKGTDSAALMVRALQLAGQRGIVMLSAEEAESAHLPESVFALQSVPHDWLFPQMAVVVHHGGAGTTGAGLRAGIPTVVVPFLGDQFFWGDRVFRLGAGPRPVPAKQLTAEKLAGAIRAAAGDERMARRAAAIGNRIRSEDGIAAAVEVVESIVRKGPRTRISYSPTVR